MKINREALVSLVNQGWSDAFVDHEGLQDILEAVTHEMAHVILVQPKNDLQKAHDMHAVYEISLSGKDPDSDEMKVSAITALVMQLVTGKSWVNSCLNSGMGNTTLIPDDAAPVFYKYLAGKKAPREAALIVKALTTLGVVSG